MTQGEFPKLAFLSIKISLTLINTELPTPRQTAMKKSDAAIMALISPQCNANCNGSVEFADSCHRLHFLVYK